MDVRLAGCVHWLFDSRRPVGPLAYSPISHSYGCCVYCFVGSGCISEIDSMMDVLFRICYDY